MFSKSYVVVRVDAGHPTTWFRGYGEFSQALTTIHYNQAAKMSLDEAKQAIYCLKIDCGGVWATRLADDPGGDE